MGWQTSLVSFKLCVTSIHCDVCNRSLVNNFKTIIFGYHQDSLCVELQTSLVSFKIIIFGCHQDCLCDGLVNVSGKFQNYYFWVSPGQYLWWVGKRPHGKFVNMMMGIITLIVIQQSIVFAFLCYLLCCWYVLKNCFTKT
jgi:hypothetical protein